MVLAGRLEDCGGPAVAAAHRDAQNTLGDVSRAAAGGRTAVHANRAGRLCLCLRLLG
jgi:hypothetical protein